MAMLKRSLKSLIRWLCQRAYQPTQGIVDFPVCVRIQSPYDTLDCCRNLIAAEQKGIYLRFGDGDVNLLYGHSEKMQSAHPKLASEMQEAFNLEGPGIVKGLPLHSPRFNLWPGMAPGIFGSDDQTAISLLSRCYPYFIGSRIYSSVALHYLAVFDPPAALDFLKFLKAQNLIAFVGNENVPEPLLRKLFGEIIHIRTPSRDSYSDIDRIEREVNDCLKQRNGCFGVVVVAMGCSGRVLAKRIYNSGANAFMFDFGSLLDALCGWTTRKWIEIAPYDVKQILAQM